MNYAKNIFFWGSLWGILEATLGWGLHLIHFKGEALILYPFGLMCMMMAAKQNADHSSVIKVAGVAALIKLVNLFMIPAVPAFHVTNPAVAIFLEGLVTWGFFYLMQKRPEMWKGSWVISTLFVFASFFLFRGWQLVMDFLTVHNPGAHRPLNGSMLFLWGWRSLAQGLMLWGMTILSQRLHLQINLQTLTSRLAIPAFLIACILNTVL